MTARVDLEDLSTEQLNNRYAGKLASVVYGCTCRSCPTPSPDNGDKGLIQGFGERFGNMSVRINSDWHPLEDEQIYVWVHPNELISFYAEEPS